MCQKPNLNVMVLQVELEVDMSARAGTSLSTALTALFADEQLDEDNQYACSSCKQRVGVRRAWLCAWMLPMLA